MTENMRNDFNSLTGTFFLRVTFLNNQLGDLNEINKSWAYTSLNFVHKNFLFLFHSSMTK